MKLLYAQVLIQQLTINVTLIYDNLFSATNIGFALYNRAGSVVVTSNVAEHTENTGIYNSTSNVYLLSSHSITLDLGLFSAGICAVTDIATACLPIGVDFEFPCICLHYNMQRFFIILKATHFVSSLLIFLFLLEDNKK